MSATVTTYHVEMGRWEPGAADRLRAAALESFTVNGYEQTTAAQIAEAAGLTQRTFFRYFADKRDVLFQDQATFVRLFLDGLEATEPTAAPMAMIAASLESAATWFPDERRHYSRKRQAVIDANPALQERERHKLAGIAEELAQALRGRGIEEPMATLAAESGATVFGLAFAQWILESETRSLDVIAVDLLTCLRSLSAAE